MTSVSADSSLMLASFNVFDRRWTWLAYSRISCLGMRSRPRSSWIGGSSNKARRISPCVNHSANHIASFTSVFRRIGRSSRQ